MAEPARPTRRRSLKIALVVLGVGALVAAVWTDVDARLQSSHEEAALAAAQTDLAGLRHDVETTQFAKAVTSAKRDSLQASITSTLSQLAAAKGSLADANVNAFVQGEGINTLQTCLGGVKSAFTQISAGKKPCMRPRTSPPSRVPARSWRVAPAPAWSIPSTSRILPSSWWVRPISPTPPTRWPATSRSSTRPTSPTGARSETPCRGCRPGPHPTTPGPPPSP